MNFRRQRRSRWHGPASRTTPVRSSSRSSFPSSACPIPCSTWSARDLLERLKRGERPSVITTAHLGAWELLASLLGDVSDHPRLTVVRTYKNKLMDYVTTRLRSSHGADVIGHREAAFPVLRALRKNGYAAFLADHNTSRSEAFFRRSLARSRRQQRARCPCRPGQGLGLGPSR